MYGSYDNIFYFDKDDKPNSVLTSEETDNIATAVIYYENFAREEVARKEKEKHGT